MLKRIYRSVERAGDYLSNLIARGVARVLWGNQYLKFEKFLNERFPVQDPVESGRITLREPFPRWMTKELRKALKEKHNLER